jgi:beta-lactam-binding protein with PASTA domain
MSRIIQAQCAVLILFIFIHMLANTALATPMMPNVLGKSLEDTRQQLTALGIHISSIQEQQTHNGEGQVIVQTPLTGAAIFPNTPVHLIVARPLKKLNYTKVPNLKDLSLEQAKAALEKAQLNLGTIKKHRIRTDDGIYVLYQTPVNGERRVINTDVNITLSDPIPQTRTHVKLNIDKKQLTVGETITLSAEIGNPIQGVKPKYSFNINGKIIPNDSPTLDYTFDKTGRCIVIANARYGKQPWLSSPAKLIQVEQGSKQTPKTQPAIIETHESQAEDNPIIEKWQNPKAIISPRSLGVKHGEIAVFHSRSTATPNTRLSLAWKTPNQQFNQQSKIRIDTSQLKAGKIYTVRLRVEDERGLVDSTKAHLHIAKIKKPRNEQNDIQQLVDYNKHELNEISFERVHASLTKSSSAKPETLKAPTNEIEKQPVVNTEQQAVTKTDHQNNNEPVPQMELQKQLAIARQKALEADQPKEKPNHLPEKIAVSPDANHSTTPVLNKNDKVPNSPQTVTQDTQAASIDLTQPSLIKQAVTHSENLKQTLANNTISEPTQATSDKQQTLPTLSNETPQKQPHVPSSASTSAQSMLELATAKAIAQAKQDSTVSNKAIVQQPPLSTTTQANNKPSTPIINTGNSLPTQQAISQAAPISTHKNEPNYSLTQIQRLISATVSEAMALPSEPNKQLLLVEQIEKEPLQSSIQKTSDNIDEKISPQQHISRGNIALRLSTHQLLAGGTIKLNVEPVSTLASEEFELVVEHYGDQQTSEQFVLPTINAEHHFHHSGRYSLYANVMTDNGWVQSPTIHIRVWPLWLPMLIVVLVGALLLLHLRLKNRTKKPKQQKAT